MLIWRLLIWGGGAPLRAKRRVRTLIIWQEAANYGHICKHVRQVIGRFTDLLYEAQTKVTEKRWDSHTSRMLQSCKSVSANCSDREYWTFVLSSWSDINNCYSPHEYCLRCSARVIQSREANSDCTCVCRVYPLALDPWKPASYPSVGLSDCVKQHSAGTISMAEGEIVRFQFGK